MNVVHLLALLLLGLPVAAAAQDITVSGLAFPDSVGGFAVMPWKKENGARLVRPSAEIVETQAMGRGKIVLVIQP